MPQLFNPPTGFIFNANNAIVPPDNDPYLGQDWEEPYRARRIQQYFDTTDKHSLDTSAAMQADIVSLAATDLLPNSSLKHHADGRPREAGARLARQMGRRDGQGEIDRSL